MRNLPKILAYLLLLVFVLGLIMPVTAASASEDSRAPGAFAMDVLVQDDEPTGEVAGNSGVAVAMGIIGLVLLLVAFVVIIAAVSLGIIGIGAYYG